MHAAEPVARLVTLACGQSRAETGRGRRGERGARARARRRGKDRPAGRRHALTEYLLDCPLDERGLAFGFEDRSGPRARHARSLEERIALVDQANDARP